LIAGGGLAGLISGIQLAKAGIPVVIIEKKSYPLHKVCGEYISHETTPFLKANGLYPQTFQPPQIKRFQLSSVKGKSVQLMLDLGGFGISRFSFDQFLFEKAKQAGAEVYLEMEVTDIRFTENKFHVVAGQKEFTADVVLGAFGKRSKLDATLGRDFIKRRSPYAGVKYHIQRDHPNDLIALHNFEGGYCGMSNVENGRTNLCYLTHRDNLRKYGDIATMEKEILYRNPFLKDIFLNSTFLLPKPEVINEISFETKEPVEDHVLMIGDAAGMITPLCGNGMAMAIHSAKLVSEVVIDFCTEKNSRLEMEQWYRRAWSKNFQYRLWKGRKIQALFGNQKLSNFAVNLALHSKPIAKALVRNTHGNPF
jgi:flavin-dependent dehydrogenase